MNGAPHILSWLRNWPRGYKFAVLLVAAWAPFLLPQSPLWTATLMALATTLFFVATGPRSMVHEHESLSAHGTHDAES